MADAHRVRMGRENDGNGPRRPRTAPVSVEVWAKMTSTSARTSSAASSVISSGASAQRNSNARFRPSIQPRSRNPSRNASTRGAKREAGARPRYPIRATFRPSRANEGCGAMAALETSLMNSRRLIRCFANAWGGQASSSRAKTQRQKRPKALELCA